MSAPPPRPALLALEDGLVLSGVAAGAPGTALGEMVFTTAMNGYQESVTDPSYLGQILCFAAPMIGNYGVGEGCAESDRVWPSAVVMARASDAPGVGGATGWRSWLAAQGVVAIQDVDTRRLVRRLREPGAVRGGVSTELSADELIDRVRAHPRLDGVDLTVPAAGTARELGGEGPRVVVLDCGMKAGIGRGLVEAGARVEVVPATEGAKAVLARRPDGVVASNGPGDPAGAAAATDTIRGLLGRVPLFGVCMGHQLLARAAGLETERLPFGHRGANHPVRRADDGSVEVTVQNHGYAVRADRLPDGVRVTHTSLFDGTVEGIALPDLRARSVQYHPEARPGPRDGAHLFADFVAELA